MTCKELVEWITEYLEGAMSRDDRLKFEQHLAACPGCTQYLAQLRETIRLTGRLPHEDIPSDTRQSLVRAFRELNRSRPSG
jgi:anti-sigma factor RsiW